MILGVAWFRDEQWPLLRSLAADPEKLEQTHAEWVVIAEEKIRELVKMGITVRKAHVDVNELHAWCLARKRPLDSSARATYAMELMNTGRQPG
jgi:hypothetical protein